MAEDCIFCKIVNGETDTSFVYENDKLVVFKDINPEAPVHLLIVPRRHIRSVNDLTDADRDIVSEMVMTAKEMARQFSVDKSGYRVFFNVEKGGGQLVFHLHMHLIGGWK
ncbi:MAG TPA: histidine triad nucleotide-binding protein [Desulfosalsimonadaceae bacterium]|nr:histidine triad nucleotide-binding protein [Desulfosalsimonadaceae bacterium]